MRRERSLQQAEKDRLIVILTKNTAYMICAALFLFCNPYFLQCYSGLFMICYYVYLHIYICILHISVLHICKYIYYCRFFGDQQCRFCKKLHRRAYLLLFKNMLRRNDGWSFRASYSFLVCSVLPCLAPQLKLQYKVSLLTLYDAGFGSYGTTFWPEITTIKI